MLADVAPAHALATSLLEYKRDDDHRRRQAADELTRLGQDMGLI